MYENPDGVMIGLEVHVQLNKLKTKVFCGCSTDYHNDPPNSHVCPVCLGLPGSLPVINRKAVEAAIKIGLALNCRVEEHTQFYRKNYYYPDLPKGFQITQYDFPISSGGYIMIEGEDGEHRVGITRAHMEEDPGRLVHEGTIDKSKYTLIDYNRSGMALIEIVSEPDMRSPKEARRYLDKLRNILEYLDIFDGDLEGALRVDANISIMGGQRAEIKNISSHKGAERALLFEIVRQKNVLRRGGVVVQETRHFDEAREITLSMRSKEEAHDYRYFPEPDLVPLKISGWAPAIKAMLPELPDAQRARFVEVIGISDEHAKALTSELKIANFFEDLAKKVDPNMAADWIARLKGQLNFRDLSIEVFKKEDMVRIIQLLLSKEITEYGAMDIIMTLLDKGGSPDEIVKEKGLLKVEGDIVAKATEEAIKENPQAVADLKAGKVKALNSIVGVIMKKTNKRADARTAREVFLEMQDITPTENYVLHETGNIGIKLYEAAEKLNMIKQLKELRRNVKVIRGDEIEGGFVGILMALGAEMDRKNKSKNEWDEKTGPIAYEEATKIDDLLKNIELICLNSGKHYFGMLRQLGFEMTQKHGRFGER